MTKWEYLRINVSYTEDGVIDRIFTSFHELFSNVAPPDWDEHLNQLGKEGWELTSVINWNDGYDECYIFKRPLENKEPGS